MTCDEIDELLAAYSLGALSPEERAAVEGHLATCARHATTLAELQDVVTRLPLAVAAQEPSPQLRSRILAAFDAERDARPKTEPTLVRPPAERWWRLLMPRPAFAYAAAALLLLAAIGLAAWNVALQAGDDGSPARVAELRGEGSGRVTYLADQDLAVLELDLREAPAERVYQAWGIYGQEPVSLGLVPNRGLIALRADLADADAVAISVEPEGGSALPTSEPVLVGALD